MKVCPRCGRTEKEVPFIGFLCKDCYLAMHSPISLPKISLRVCPTCGKVYAGGRWREYSLEAIRNWLKHQVKTDLSDAYISVGLSRGDGGLRAIFLIRGNIEGVTVTVKRAVEIPIVYEQCPSCSKRAGGYYEAIIQVRGRDSERVAERIVHLIEKEKGEGAYVTRTVYRREGVDIYVGSRSVARKIAARVARTLNASIKRSFTLVTEKAGRKIYRETILLRV